MTDVKAEEANRKYGGGLDGPQAKVIIELTLPEADVEDLLERLECDMIMSEHPWIPGAHLKKVQSIQMRRA